MIRRFLGLVVTVVGALAVAESDAAGAPPEHPPSREVWIEARPWTCAHELGALVRETELACDALGGQCRVAASEDSATHRAVLLCDSPTHWTLRLEEAAGASRVSVELGGDREERLRKAAMWIARLEDAGPAPVPAAAAVPLAPLVPVRAATQPPAADATSGAAATLRRGGLMLGATTGLTSSAFADAILGLHGAIAFPLGPLHVGAAGGYERGFMTGHQFDGAALTTSVGRAGLRLGWGAPFDDHVLGIAVESGVAWGARVFDYTFLGASRPSDFTNAYGRAEVIVQVPLKPIRPYLALGASHTLGQFGEGVSSGSASAGLSWQAW